MVRGGKRHDQFRFDAWRVAMNVAVDWLWFGKDTWEERSRTGFSVSSVPKG